MSIVDYYIRVFPSSAEHPFIASLRVLNRDSPGSHDSCIEWQRNFLR